MSNIDPITKSLTYAQRGSTIYGHGFNLYKTWANYKQLQPNHNLLFDSF